MDILDVDDSRFSMEPYDNYNDALNTGYFIINDGTEIYSVFFVYDGDIEEKLMDEFDSITDEEVFNMMQYSDTDGLVWLDIEDDELVVYSEEDIDTIDDIENFSANNYYNDDINDFINDLKQLESSDIIRLFVFKNTKTNEVFQYGSGELDDIYTSLNILGNN